MLNLDGTKLFLNFVCVSVVKSLGVSMREPELWPFLRADILQRIIVEQANMALPPPPQSTLTKLLSAFQR